MKPVKLPGLYEVDSETTTLMLPQAYLKNERETSWEEGHENKIVGDEGEDAKAAENFHLPDA